MGKLTLLVTIYEALLLFPPFKMGKLTLLVTIYKALLSFPHLKWEK